MNRAGLGLLLTLLGGCAFVRVENPGPARVVAPRACPECPDGALQCCCTREKSGELACDCREAAP